MKYYLIIIISVLVLCPMIQQKSYAQYRKVKPTSSKQYTNNPRKVSRADVLKTIDKNTKSLRKNLNGTWLLEEDFESGIFPPAGWSIGFGDTEWQQAFVSGYGTGDYSMFYSNWNCTDADNIIYTSDFTPTTAGDKLIFDHAYAPYDNGSEDDLEIFYYDENLFSWVSLVYYNGFDLQTSPATEDYFVPESNEWGTKIIDIPEGATSIYFQSLEDCSNNLYIDNIRVGSLPDGMDASVEKVWAKGKLPLVFGVPDTISTLVKNTGGSILSNLKVYLNVTGANNYSDSVEIPSIVPGDTMQVNFAGFNPVLNGFSDVTVSLPDDDNNGNNTGMYLTQVNSNTFRYVDSNCCNSSVGWLGELSFLNKYRMSGTGQIRRVNIKISQSDPVENSNIGQIVYGIVIDKNGIVVGKSPHYKIQASDEGKYKSFEITDPKPFIATNEYFYVGIAQTEFAGSGFVYAPQQFNSDAPTRPNANYGSYLGPVGTSVSTFEFSREYGQNYAIEAVIGNQVSTDAGIADLGLMYDQYFTTATITPAGKVFNAGTGSATFNVRRTITPGGYSSTKSVSALTAGSNAIVTFDPWTFTSGTTYTVRDSILSSDGNSTNNQMTSSITPRVAKQLCVLWQHQTDRDSLVRAINTDGRYANNFDTVRMNYTGSYRSWKIMFVNFRDESNYSPWVRDSLKMFIDNSTAGNKKSLVVFGNAIAFYNDPSIYFPSPADSIFYRQYLKSRTISDNWPGSIPASENKFRGVGFFDGITQDSLSDPFTPELIKPTNGSTAAFKPKSVTGNGNDSCNAVSFAGTNYNTFFMTNRFSSLRASSGSLRGPVLVYTKIIDWIQSINTGVKILDLTMLMEGFYNSSTNYMNSDTVKVILRNATSPFARVDSAKGYLSPSGQASFVFNTASNGVNYLIQIVHRNGVETWSRLGQSFAANHLNYNFTTDSAKAYGFNMKKEGTKWVFYGGDVNKDGVVEGVDISLVDNAAYNFESGYVSTDVNGDGVVDGSDFSIADNNAAQFISKATPLSLLDNDYTYINDKTSSNKTENIQDEIRIDHKLYEINKNKIVTKSFKDLKFMVFKK